MMTNARNRTTYQWKTKNILRIATWNIKSLNTREQELTKELMDAKVDICALQETRKKGKGQIMLDNYIMIYSGVPKETRAKEGVAILVQKRLTIQIEECKYESKRNVAIRMRLGEELVNIIGIYAPENNREQNIRERFFEDLKTSINDMPSKGSMIVLDDFNDRIGNDIIPGI
ncbi:craniofacial development protein 2-like [Diorhabda carinulata]|uniref:craniofacial development protein 2-like n=1 Tax=Diorhabda carinulata TaxID=1163345 RepID=UPI0025A00739|nr:craniofacial development protein 2-like [Diorhabda carinulata]